MPVGTRKVGKVARVSIGGTYYEVKSGSFSYTVETVDVTNSESAGYQEMEPGILRGTFDVTINYRGSAPPSILVGTEVVVEVVFNPTSKRFSTAAIVTSVGDSWSVAGDYNVQIQGVSTGVFYPYAVA